MPYYDSEAIERARQVDLLTYLQTCEPQELVHVSGNVYCTKTHDSLRISNGKWCWFSRGIGGYSALDYLIKVNGYSFLEAMETISGRAAIPPPSFVPAPKEEKPKHLLLPQAAPDNRAMMAYLKGRGIDQEILDYCVQTGRIYESRNKGHGNVVFVGFDKTGKARFGCLRGISEGRFHGDLSGSDKHYSFALPACGKNPAVHLCECAIDVMSYASLCRLDGIDWKQHNLLSLAGVYQPKKKIAESKLPVALTRFLEDYPHVKTVYLHLDNDGPGRMAAEAIQTVISKEYEVKNCPPPRGKDVNDYLCRRLGIPIRGAKGKEQVKGLVALGAGVLALGKFHFQRRIPRIVRHDIRKQHFSNTFNLFLGRRDVLRQANDAAFLR